MVSKVEMFQSHTSPHLSSSRSVAYKRANQSHMTTAKMSDPRFTLAHHSGSSSSVIRAPDQTDHGGSWVQIASRTRTFSEFPMRAISITYTPVACFSNVPNVFGLFRVPQFPLYLRNAEVPSHQTSQSS